jgi:tetratricopeptide (TPR) repeat protein
MRTFLTRSGQQHVASDQRSRPMQEPQQTQQYDEYALWAAYLDAKRSHDAASAEAASAKLQSVFTARLAVNQRDGYALLRMGKLLHDAKQYDAAVEYYQRAGALGGDFEMVALLSEGGTRAEQGRYKEASVLLRQALEIREDDGVRDFLNRIQTRIDAAPATDGGPSLPGPP